MVQSMHSSSILNIWNKYEIYKIRTQRTDTFDGISVNPFRARAKNHKLPILLHLITYFFARNLPRTKRKTRAKKYMFTTFAIGI